MLLAAEDISGWASLVGSVANMGFAAVVGYYLLTKAIPRMQDDFNSELKAQRDAFDKQVEAQRITFDRQTEVQRVTFDGHEKERRTEYKDSLDAVIKHCERESIRQTDMLKSELAGMGKVIDDNREVMEEVRDALREFSTTLKEFARARPGT